MENDLISKKHLSDRIRSIPDITGLGLEPVIATSTVLEFIETEPSVEAVPVVHGRWNYEYDDPIMMPCSECNYKVYRYNNTSFCPNCSADMREVKR